MLRVLLLMIVQSAMLAGAQVFLKIALARMAAFGWTREFWTSVLLNWQFAASGCLFGSASLLWLYVTKHYPLSVAYPLTSLSFVFGVAAAALLLHEDVQALKWVGVLLIVAGGYLIAK